MSACTAHCDLNRYCGSIWAGGLLLLLFLLISSSSTRAQTAPTAGVAILVATCDSAPQSRAMASFVGSCSADQQVINAAIHALPPVGGIVQLAEGTYDIRAVPGTRGGVVIDRSNVILRGSGTATKLVLADGQNTNVIRIDGDGTHDVLIEELQIDANRNANEAPGFETCGIKAATSGHNPQRNIVVRQNKVFNAHRLNVMLDGQGVRVLDNWFGDAGSDVAEILTGPGEISRNYVEIAGTTGYGLGSDTADNVTISDNTVVVLPGASITQAVYRTWQGRYQSIVSGNQAIIYGQAQYLLMMNGYFNVVQGNIFRNWGGPAKARVDSAATIVGNIFANVDLEIANSSGAHWPVTVTGNVFFGSTVNDAAGVAVAYGNARTF
jgi:hypothetical protein